MEVAAGAQATPPFHRPLAALVLRQGDLGLEGSQGLTDVADNVTLSLSQTQGNKVLGVGVTELVVGGKDEVLFARTVVADVEEFFRVVVEHGSAKTRAPGHVSLTGGREGSLNCGQEVRE